MKHFAGKTLRWDWRDGLVELTLDHEPANEIGTETLADLEKFVAAIPALAPETAACIISSSRKQGFSAGADLRQLYRGAEPLSPPSMPHRSSPSPRFTASVSAAASSWLSRATSSSPTKWRASPSPNCAS